MGNLGIHLLQFTSDYCKQITITVKRPAGFYFLKEFEQRGENLSRTTWRNKGSWIRRLISKMKRHRGPAPQGSTCHNSRHRDQRTAAELKRAPRTDGAAHTAPWRQLNWDIFQTKGNHRSKCKRYNSSTNNSDCPRIRRDAYKSTRKRQEQDRNTIRETHKDEEFTRGEGKWSGPT